jgi:hypothetical protein
MHQIGKLAKLRRDIGEVEIIVRENELLKMMKREERIIGMRGSVKHAEREVQFSHLPGFQVTSSSLYPLSMTLSWDIDHIDNF